MLQVGRAPANLSSALAELTERGLVEGDIWAVCTGPPAQSTDPRVHASYQRRAGGPDRAGGGAVIPCDFELNVKNLRQTMSIFEKNIPRNDLNERFYV